MWITAGELKLDLNSEENAERRVSTEVFAARNLVKPQSVIKRRCQTGSFHGVLARELASGRLDWPDITVVKQRKGAQK